MIRRRMAMKWLIIFLIPAVFIYTWLLVMPLLDTMRLTFYSSAGGTDRWIGLGNYEFIFGNEFMWSRFVNAMVNNLVYFVIHLAVQIPLGILLAGLLTVPKLRGRAAFRTVFFIPTTLSVVITGFLWQLILNPVWGIVDTPLLGRESTALPTLALISVWQYVGIPMIFFYAVLIRMPAELFEAAEVDGANQLQIFRRVKLPLMLPMIGIVTIVTYLSSLNAFDLIFAVRGSYAGPNYSTDIFGTLFYRTAFGADDVTLGSLTLGATVATLVFIVMLIGSLIYLFFVQRRLVTYDY